MGLGYYKLALRGTYVEQNIVNVLYYGDEVGDPFPDWDLGYANDLGDSLAETFGTDYTDPLPLTYTWVDVAVSYVDPRGTVTSPYEVVIPVGQAGDQADTTDGAYQAAVLAFQTQPVAFLSSRNVKRSYLAYGPLTSTWIGNSGLLDASFATAIAPLLTALISSIGGGLTDYRPVRIGRTVAPAAHAVGTITAGTLRPYATVRKSRKRRPTGT